MENSCNNRNDFIADFIMFSCAHCPAAFHWEHMLDKHKLRKHSNGGENRHKCGVCEQEFMDADSLRCHEINAHGRVLNCITQQYFLPIVFFNSETLTWDCANCDKTFMSKSQLEDHLLSHALNIGVRNDTTVFSAVPPPSSSIIQNIVPPPRKCHSKPVIIFNSKTNAWECSECDLTFKLQSQLEKHLQLHNFTEKICESQFSPPTAAVPSVQSTTRVGPPYQNSPRKLPSKTATKTKSAKNQPKTFPKSEKSLFSSPVPVKTKKIKQRKPMIVKEGVHRICIMREGLSCKRCKIGFLKKQALVEHLCIHHPNEKRHSQQKFPEQSEENLSNNLEGGQENYSSRDQSMLNFNCKMCSVKIQSEEDLLKHIIEVHSKQFLIDGKSYYCHQCQMKFTRLSSFHIHLKLQHMSQTPGVTGGGGEGGESSPHVNENGGNSDDDVSIVKIVQKDDSVIKSGGGFKIEVISTEEIFPSTASTTWESGNGGTVDYFKCKMCNKVFATVKALRIHERMLHADALASKFSQYCRDNNGKRRSENRKLKRGETRRNFSKSQKASIAKCYELLFKEVAQRLSCAEKLMKKVKECKRKGRRNKSLFSCTMTPSGIKIFCKEMTRGRPSNRMIGYKRPGNPVSSITSQSNDSVVGGGADKRSVERKNIYQCIVCGLQLSGVSILKRHVMSEHVDRFERRSENQRNFQRKPTKLAMKSQESNACPSVESVPIPLIVELDDEEKRAQSRLLSQQIDEEIVVQDDFSEEIGPTENSEKIRDSISAAPTEKDLITSAKDNAELAGNCITERSPIRTDENPRLSRGENKDAISAGQLPDSTDELDVTKSIDSEYVQDIDTLYNEKNVEGQQEKVVAHIASKSDYERLKTRTIQISLTRVDDEDFDFNELLYLNKIC